MKNQNKKNAEKSRNKNDQKEKNMKNQNNNKNKKKKLKWTQKSISENEIYNLNEKQKKTQSQITSIETNQKSDIKKKPNEKTTKKLIKCEQKSKSFPSKLFKRFSFTFSNNKPNESESENREYIEFSSDESDYFAVELNGETKILNNEICESINSVLNFRYSQANWKLVYSTEIHGTSFITFYEKIQTTSCSLLFIQTKNNEILGTFLPLKLKINNSFYGDGQIFLFTFYPTFKMFKAKTTNDLYIFSNNESIMIGGGSQNWSRSGLWISKNFIHGASHFCETFENDQLASTTEFEIARVELWEIEK
ncbi:nucleolar protein 7/estrogen receptor coactivator-related [Anaeramoeba flamelloides]|uniref:Oxidation resistance protein 1 n=1 Tax=Anaeramoeba flamelloides TaxID=1746091 RepID=A0ABQ8XID6_9EUKA|nr:nucleolar protein 7/estrogen receptor coactivator-related [Anaeramoeba flamelloides]